MVKPQLAVILNVEAGKARQKNSTDIEAALTGCGLTYRVVKTGDRLSPERAATKAIDDGTDHLCACGGDGTVAQVVNAIMKSGRPGLRLSIVPMGTANLIGEALGIPCEIESAVKTLQGDDIREVDVGKIDGRYFVLGLGIGAAERFVTQTSDASKKRLGRLAYALSLLRQTGEAPFQLKIEVDGKTSGVEHAEASTLANFWGTSKVRLLKNSCPDDGKMELLINQRLTRLGLVRLAWDGLLGRLQSCDDVNVHQGTTFVIHTEPSLPVQLDGSGTDLKTPCRVEIVRRALRVSTPTKSAARRN